jgi:serine/threonine-protein kinase
MLAPAPGATLGNYRLLEEIGEGGMGRVYLAEHSLIGRRAAIKVLLPRHSNDGEAVRRFFTEARATTRIRHPGIVDILDFGFADDGRAFIVMELLEGRGLGQLLRASAPLAEPDVVRYLRQIASALGAAHEAGIIHRDLKPDNVYVVPAVDVVGGERVKVLDFGIAKLASDASGGPSVSRTATGQVMGSPLYMSPEQCSGAGAVDHRADIYSLGCIGFEMVTARAPFVAPGVGAVLAQHIYEPPMAPRSLNPAVAPAIDELILALLAKSPDRRPQTMAEVVQILDRISAGAFAHSRPHVVASAPVPFQPERFAPTMAHTPSPLSRTTHDTASGQLTAVPARRRGPSLALIAGLVLAGAAAATAFVMSSRGGEPTAASATTPVVAAEAPDAAAAEEPPAIEEEPAAAEPSATPLTAALAITTDPSGAVVKRSDGQLVGETPLRVEIDRGEEPVELLVSRDGYRDQRLSLVPDRDREEHLVLERKRSRKRPARKSNDTTPPPRKKKKGGFGETIDPLAGD